MLDPALSKLVMSVSLVCVVFPAWRFFILPRVEKLKSADTVAKLKLEKAIEYHGRFLLSNHHDEAALDKYYLQLKDMRRKAHNLPHPTKVAPKKKLLHMRVTPKGLVQVDDADDEQHEQ